MAPLITKQIQEQLTEHKAVDLQKHVVDEDEGDEVVVKGKMENRDAVWWEGWRKRLRTDDDGDYVKSGQSDDEDDEGGHHQLKRKNRPAPAAVKNEDDDMDEEDEIKPIDVKTLVPLVSDSKAKPELRIMIKVPKSATFVYETIN